jgi:F0F1-type ATP synthase assembly protein I
MAFEFLVAIGLGAWLGTYTDRWLGNQKPIATLLLMMLFLGAALFHIIRSLMKEQ